jgi:serine/threonine protein phosphatase PrpC
MGNAFAFQTRAASSRVRSEDRAHVFEHEDGLIIVVADGAGGIGGGANACDALVHAVRTRVAEQPFDPYNLRAWSDAVTRTDAELAGSAAGGETTAIVVAVGPHGVAGVSVGDSEAWMVSAGIDRLTERQDRTRVGTGKSRPRPFHRSRLQGVLVVATDGLFRHAKHDEICACCASTRIDDIACALASLPKLRSGSHPDDVALVVVKRAT